MEKHGLTAADIDGHAGGKRGAKKARAKAVVKASPAAVKYRDPKSGATWSGHGRTPKWIASAKNRDKFLVDGTLPVSEPAASKVKAAANKTSKSVSSASGNGQRRVRSRRSTVTPSRAQLGAGEGGPRHGLRL
jgi:hypothetical protein